MADEVTKSHQGIATFSLDYNPEDLLNIQDSDSETESINDDTPVNVSDLIDSISEMNDMINQSKIVNEEQIRKRNEKEEKEKLLAIKEKNDLIKMKAFFKVMQTDFRPDLYKKEFLCEVYDYCLAQWNDVDFPDENVFLFKKIVYFLLKQNVRYNNIINKIVMGLAFTNMIVINKHRIFLLEIDSTENRETYNLKHDGSSYYLL